jgi:uncharacterized damage-inducible protein DinB
MSKRTVLLKALAAAPSDLTRIVLGMTETAVSTRPAPDEWSISDVLCHLTMVEERYLLRLKIVAAEQRPFLPSIHPDEAAHDLTLSRETYLNQFRQARQETLDFLHTIKAGDWQRSAQHDVWGWVKFRYLVQHLIEHDTAHLNQIIDIQRKL